MGNVCCITKGNRRETLKDGRRRSAARGESETNFNEEETLHSEAKHHSSTFSKNSQKRTNHPMEVQASSTRNKQQIITSKLKSSSHQPLAPTKPSYSSSVIDRDIASCTTSEHKCSVPRSLSKITVASTDSIRTHNGNFEGTHCRNEGAVPSNSGSIFRSIHPETWRRSQVDATASSCMKRCTFSEVKGQDYFENYAQYDASVIGPEGIVRFCEDLQIDVEDFQILVFAWKCSAKRMCEFSRSEFLKGLCSLRSDSVASLRAALSVLSSQVAFQYCDGSDDDSNAHGSLFLESVQFADLYKWSFEWAQESDTQRGRLPVQTASQLWKVVFSGHGRSGSSPPPILEYWLEFILIHGDSIGYISKDTWDLFLLFLRRCARDLSTYDESDAWPSLFDDFVQFHNDQTNQNFHPKSNSAWEAESSPDGGNLVSSP